MHIALAPPHCCCTPSNWSPVQLCAIAQMQASCLFPALKITKPNQKKKRVRKKTHPKQNKTKINRKRTEQKMTREINIRCTFVVGPNASAQHTILYKTSLPDYNHNIEMSFYFRARTAFLLFLSVIFFKGVIPRWIPVRCATAFRHTHTMYILFWHWMFSS